MMTKEKLNEIKLAAKKYEDARRDNMRVAESKAQLSNILLNSVGDILNTGYDALDMFEKLRAKAEPEAKAAKPKAASEAKANEIG